MNASPVLDALPQMQSMYQALLTLKAKAHAQLGQANRQSAVADLISGPIVGYFMADTQGQVSDAVAHSLDEYDALTTKLDPTAGVLGQAALAGTGTDVDGNGNYFTFDYDPSKWESTFQSVWDAYTYSCQVVNDNSQTFANVYGQVVLPSAAQLKDLGAKAIEALPSTGEIGFGLMAVVAILVLVLIIKVV